MLSDQITVTNDQTSIQALIATARNVDVGLIPKKCSGIMLRYSKNATSKILLQDIVAGGGSAVGAAVLDAVNENLLSTNLPQFGIDKAFLVTDAGTELVEIIITQNL